MIIDRGNDRVDLVFEVTEGARTPVRQINFIGNKAFGKRQLAAVIKTSASNMLSFLIGGDVYDPDLVAADREQLRTYYRSKGYADASVPSALAEYDPATKGFTLTFTIDEGPLYHFGDIRIVCNVEGLDREKFRRLLLVRQGAMFDGTALGKTSDVIAIELAKLGYPFAHVTPRTTRDATARRIDVAFEIDQGSRAYVERIDIHGNSRTRGYVIRREFDIAEGDAFNKGLIDRAERRLKNLNYFKTVKITAKPGSVPDRVILDVEVVERDTGDFNVAGGYSTVDGWLAEVKLGDSNFMGTGVAVKSTFTYGQYSQRHRSVGDRSIFLRQPRFWRRRYFRQADRFQQLPVLRHRELRRDDADRHAADRTARRAVALFDLAADRHASIRLRSPPPPSIAVQQAAAAGPQWVSAVGSTATYSTLDNTKAPTSGINSQLRQDLAGLGGDVRFLRTTEDLRYYHPSPTTS